MTRSACAVGFEASAQKTRPALSLGKCRLTHLTERISDAADKVRIWYFADAARGPMSAWTQDETGGSVEPPLLIRMRRTRDDTRTTRQAVIGRTRQSQPDCGSTPFAVPSAEVTLFAKFNLSTCKSGGCANAVATSSLTGGSVVFFRNGNMIQRNDIDTRQKRVRQSVTAQQIFQL